MKTLLPCLVFAVLLGAPKAYGQLDMSTLGVMGDIAWGCGYNSQYDRAYGLNVGSWKSYFTRRAHAKGASESQLQMLLVNFEAGAKEARDDGLQPGKSFTSREEETKARVALSAAYSICTRG